MRKTRLARTLLGAVGGLIVAAYLARTLMPAAIAVAIVIYFATARAVATKDFAATTLTAAHTILEPVLHMDRPATLVTTMGGSVARGVCVRAREKYPEGAHAVHGPADVSATGRVPEPWRATLRFETRGVIEPNGIQVTLTDARGLFEATREVAAPLAMRVHASAESFHKARALASKTPLDATTRNRHGLLFKDYEFDGLRPWAAGDRLRDVDWKSSSRFDKILTKTFERELEATVVILVDASRTMRARSRGSPTAEAPVSKLDHAAEMAFQIVEVAAARNHAVGVIVYDEGRVLAELPPTRNRNQGRRLAEVLVDLPGSIRVTRRPDVASLDASPLDLGERAFLAGLPRASGRVPVPREGAASVGVADALTRATAKRAHGSLHVIMMTDLEVAPDAALAAIRRLNRGEHNTVPVILPGSSYLTSPAALRVRDVENAYRESATRDRATRILRALRTTPILLSPEDTSAIILEASRGARASAAGIRGTGGSSR